MKKEKTISRQRVRDILEEEFCPPPDEDVEEREMKFNTDDTNKVYSLWFTD